MPRLAWILICITNSSLSTFCFTLKMVSYSNNKWEAYRLFKLHAWKIVYLGNWKGAVRCEYIKLSLSDPYHPSNSKV